MLRIYNTLDRKLESFKPIRSSKVSLYSCGPTVYDYAHIGNLRAFVFVDVLKRYLRYSGYKVSHVMNITDVDDKTIKGSRESNKKLDDFTTFYLKALLDDFKNFNIEKPDFMPRATGHINEMINLIQVLIDKGYAYKKNGSVYFRISKFPSYGQLAKLDQQILRYNASGRLDNDEYQKDEINDFVLWKAWQEDDGSVYWDTKIGRGRPGWHIECSAMAMKYLGETIDIHTGGIDLIFPHHTNEIAQSEAATGKKFVNYWLHNAHLFVKGQRMAKSLGNFYTLRDLNKKGYHPLLLRIILLKTHYRQILDFDLGDFVEAKNIAEKFVLFLSKLDSIQVRKSQLDIEKIVTKVEVNFKKALDDDLNTNFALSFLYRFMNDINKIVGKINADQAQEIKNFIIEADSILGFINSFYEQYNQRLIEVVRKEVIKKLLNDRAIIRENKQYEKADKIRQGLMEQGIAVEDNEDGSYFVRLSEPIFFKDS